MQDKISEQESNRITSPVIQANDLIASLARHELLDPLLKAQAESEYINNYQIGEEFESLSTQEAGNYLVKQLNIKNQEELNTWRQAHGFFKEDDVISYAQHLHKKHAVINDLLSGSSESLFLRYKDRLDRVLYSLIRVNSEDLANALYYAIEAGELEFGHAAQEYSIGPESKTQGIIGPVDLTTPHPEISARLRTATPRQLFSPFEADQWHAIIRLEYRFDSELDDKTKHFLGSLLLTAKSQDNFKALRESYLYPNT